MTVDVALVAAGALALALAVYLASCLAWPWARCWPCRKTPGKRRAWWGRSWGDCRWCAGRGKRVRVGRKLLDSVRARRRE